MASETNRWGLAGLIAVGATLCTFGSPAVAQFGTIFGAPPRPPADVPDRPPSNLPQQPQQSLPPSSNLPPPPPARGSSVQTQPLPPPPGAPAAPLDTRPPSQQGASSPPQQPQSPTPGLPPGQRQPRGTPGDTASAPVPPPSDDAFIEQQTPKVENKTAVFSGLDKITGRIIQFDVALNETVQFGALQVTPRACFTRPATELPKTDGFVEVSEVTLQGEVRRIFSGWMFAASPGLHGVEHSIYDVWLTDCKDPPQKVAEDPAPVTPSPAPAQRPARQATPPKPSTPSTAPTQRPPAAAQQQRPGPPVFGR